MRTAHPDVPPDLETICLKALAKKPADRYGTCRELAKDLARWLAGQPIAHQFSPQPPTELFELPAPANAPGQLVHGAASLPPTAVDQNLQDGARSFASAEAEVRSDRRLRWRPRTIAATVGAVIVPILGVAAFVATRQNEAKIDRKNAPALAPNAEVPARPLASSAETSEISPSPGASLTQPTPPGAAPTDSAIVAASSPAAPVASQPEVGPDPVLSSTDRSGGGVRGSTPNERQPSRSMQYHELMAEVQRGLAAKDVAAASRVLALCPVELRGWEWDYCQNLCERNAKNGAAAGTSPGSHGSEFVNQQVVTINEQAGPLANVAFSPDGTRVATISGGRRGPLKIRDARSGTVLMEKVVCDVATWALAHSPDGKWIATGSVDATVRIWDATTLTRTRAIALHASHVVARPHRVGLPWHRIGFKANGGIESITFSPDSRSTASAGDDGTVRIWNFADDIESRRNASESRDPKAGPDAGRQKKSQWDAKSGRPDKTMFRTFFREQSEVVCDVVWDRQGRWIASGGASKINFLDPKKGGEPSSTIDFLARCLAVSLDGRLIAAASMDPEPRATVWDVETRKAVLTLTGKKGISFLDFSPDGKRLATAGKWNVQIWDAKTGHQLLELGEPKDDNPQDKVFATGVRFSPDGRRIASVRGDLLRIWSIAAVPTLAGSGVAATQASDARASSEGKRSADAPTKK